VLDAAELSDLVRTMKRQPLAPASAGTSVRLDRAALHRLLPHRSPMLLVDGIDRVDLSGRSVRGYRQLHRGDLGFDGHFEGDPIYPGVMVLEAMGQLGLTLLHFTAEQRVDVPETASPGRVRATHIHHATFIAPFQPGDTMTLHARVASNDYTLTTMGQAWKGESLAAFAIFEVFVDD
jgi:3-hydroxyacyl-[acyl-carrier-protein] dehydratase